MRLFASLLLIGSFAQSALASPLQSEEEHPRPLEYVIAQQKADPRHLDRSLMALARQAAKAHRRVLVEFGAPWCVPCELIRPVFQREENRALFRGWELVQVDVDELPEGPVLGIPFDTIPFFIKLDESGHAAGTLRGGEALSGRGRASDVAAAFARFLGT